MSATVETRMEVVSEPLTYRRDAEHSYFRDMVRADVEGDFEARERLERHVEETRANPSSNTSTFAPPLWIIEDTATAPRPHRILADAVQHFPLPPGAHSVNVPRLTTGVTVQPEQDGAPATDTDLVDAAITSTVATITGQADVSQQMVDNGGAAVDAVLYRELTAAYDAQLELQMINGSGVGQNLLGLLNAIPSSNVVTFTTASPTGSGELSYLGKAMAVVGDNRSLPPELWLIRTARWAWLVSSEDLQGQALVVADWGPSGQGIMSVRVEFDDAIPATLGAGANQDAILATRPSDIMLFESGLRVMSTPEPLSGTLQVRFQMHGLAAMINLYPAGHAAVVGTGLVVQSGY
jgi:HK97 family phage major capsid protein